MLAVRLALGPVRSAPRLCLSIVALSTTLQSVHADIEDELPSCVEVWDDGPSNPTRTGDSYDGCANWALGTYTKQKKHPGHPSNAGEGDGYWPTYHNDRPTHGRDVRIQFIEEREGVGTWWLIKHENFSGYGADGVGGGYPCLTGHKASSDHRVSDDVTACKRFGNACNIEKCGTHAILRSAADRNTTLTSDAEAGGRPEAPEPTADAANPDPLFDAKEL